MKSLTTFLGLAVLGASLQAAEPIPDSHKTGGFAIGAQAYSFNRFSLFEASEKNAEAGGKTIELYPGQKLSKEQGDVELVKGRDERIGACADTGHWVRSGLKPVECLAILKGRVVSSHLKDLHEFSDKGHDVPYGKGVSDIKGVLDALKAMNFDGPISVEYEYNWDNSVPEIKECISFVRAYGEKK